jgi:ATP-dependent exoDNAse (exonuclease V) beta subunit
LRVSTLDSLFAQIARSFGLELGFPFGWQIVEELFDVRLRSRAIDAVLTSGDAAKLRTLVHLLTKGEASRSISQLIREAVNEMYDLFQETTRDAWGKIPRFPPLDAAELAAVLQELQLADAPDKRMTRARDEDLARAQQGDWSEFLTKGLAAKVAQGDPNYYKKPIPDSLVAVYRRLIEHVQAELVGRVASQTEATYELLEMFHTEYQRLKTSYRALRFEDVTRRLAGVGQNIDLGGLSFRLDARIDHLLLDEFQDTSPQQWQVLQPWAQRVTQTAGGTSFFCVGDVKQAIYGWRGGVAEIFDAIDRQLAGLTPQSLNVSFRSSPPVIEAVNRVFARLPEHPNLGRAETGVRRWSQRFEPHDTQRRTLPGYVELAAAPAAAEGQRQGEVTLHFAAERIAQLVAQAPGRSVGVLMRRNDGVARVIYELRRLDVFASEEGGNSLSDSAAVTVVLSALRLADHPGDTVARFHLVNSPLASAFELTDHRDDAAAQRVSFQVRQALMQDGYGATTQAWTRRLAPHCSRRDRSRLEQLVEKAYAYDPTATLRTSDFVAHIESTRVPDPIAADVRVMTIHQAKGLQFDIVFLPELEGHLIGQNEAVVTHRPEVTASVDCVCRYAGAEIQQLLPAAFRQMFEAATDRAVTESLCVLYVALTRAIHAWYAIIPPSTASERNLPCTQAGLLRAALADGARAEPATVLYAHGDPEWYRAGGPPHRTGGQSMKDDTPAVAGTEQAEIPPAARAAESAAAPIVVRLAPLAGGRRRGWERTRPSGLEGGTTVSLQHLLAPSRSAAFARGQLIHAWLEQVQWIEDGLPDADRLAAVARDLLAAESAAGMDLAAELVRFRSRLTSPPVADVLSRRRYEDLSGVGFSGPVLRQLGARRLRPLAQNERGFAIRDGAQLLTGFIDRLVLLEDDGQVVAAEIIDFKTDLFDAQDPQQRTDKVAFYAPQLRAYQRAVSQMTHCPPERIVATLLFVEAGIVATVE